MKISIILLLTLLSISVNADTYLLIHGNGENSDYWFSSPKALGARLANKFGPEAIDYVDYLSTEEINNPYQNFHHPKFYKVIKRAIDNTYPQEKVVIIAHSFGVTLALKTLEKYNLWHRVSQFINIAGAIRGLESCLLVGPVSIPYSTCNSESLIDSDIFGFYPSNGIPGSLGFNRWTDNNHPSSFRFIPQKRPSVIFKTFHIGLDDGILCKINSPLRDCTKSAIFSTSENHIEYDLTGKGHTHYNLPHEISIDEIFEI